MATAGRAVVFSGLAVAIGLALLLVVPVPFIRTLGLGGLLIPLVSVAAALTLQPVLLSFCGPRAVDRRAPAAAAVPRGRRLARTVTRRPVPSRAAVIAVLLACAAPALSLRLTPGSLDSLPGSTESQQGLVALRHAFGPGALTPTQIVVDAAAPARRGRRRARGGRASRDGCSTIPRSTSSRSAAPYVSADGR